MIENSEVFSDSGNNETNTNSENVFDDTQQLQSKTVDNSKTYETVKTEPQGSSGETTYTYDENAAIDNSLMFSKGITPKESEWKRCKNWEEASPLICNIFYCFYFPFICRIAPLREENIPQISDKDKSQLNTDIFRSKWDPVARGYGRQMAEYERKHKLNRHDHSIKKPKYPSLLKIIFKSYFDLPLFCAVICLLLSTAFQVVQPTLTKEVIQDSYSKYLHDSGLPGYSDKFPFAAGIILMLCPLLNALFEALGNRIFFHFAGKLRSALCGMIFEKTLRLNMSSQSGLDSGRLLTLISADARNIAEMMPMLLMLATIPVQFIVPLVFLLVDVGACSLFTFAVILVCLPLILVVLVFVGNNMKEFLRCNDYRTKLVNETFEGIRVVKFSGLESFFVNRIVKSREEQVGFSSKVVFFIQIMNVVMRMIPSLVNFVVIAFYIFAMDNTQVEFIQTLQPNLPYLSMMTTSTTILPMLFQAFMMLSVSFNRINEFLVMKEAEEVVRDEPVEVANGNEVNVNNNNNNSTSSSSSNSSEQEPIVFQIVDGVFKWDSAAKLPKSLVEKEAEKKARKAKEKEEAKKNYVDVAKFKDKGSNIDELANPGVDKTATVTIEVGAIGGENMVMHPEMVNSPTPTPTPSPSPTPTPTPLPSSLVPNPSPNSPEDVNPSSSSSSSSSEKHDFALRNVNLTLRKGSLTMVIGSVGCGKSSLGATVVNDIRQISGDVRMKKGISIAYNPQTPWIINGTVKENIMLSDESGKDNSSSSSSDADSRYLQNQRELKYRHIVHVCALETDFQILAAGDMTAIGEKGVNLSGGQKARIQLARSVYADRDFYILDDPLSAVDAHVGRFLFNECILKELKGRGKTVMLMTNQLQFLNKADHVVVLSDGAIVDQGTAAELRSRGIDFSQFIMSGDENGEKKKNENENNNNSNNNNNNENNENKDSTPNPTPTSSPAPSPSGSPAPTPTPAPTPAPTPTPTPTPTPQAGGEGGEGEKKKKGTEIMTEEEQMTGGIPWSTYFKYWFLLLPNWRMILFLLILLISNAITAFQQYWLGVVGTDQWGDTFSFNWKIYMMAILIGVGLIFFLFQAIMAYFMERRSGITLHSNLINNVIQCPSSFFDTTPLGRVLNRFTGDLTQVDMMLMTTTLSVAGMWLGMVGQIVIVAVDNPVFLAIGAVAIVLFYGMLKLYSRAARNFQRLESMARSPVLSVFSEILSGAGLTTIRSFGLEGRWKKKFNRLNDDWTARFIVFREGQKWATIYGSVISCALLICIIIIGWFNMEPAKITVAISSAMMFGMYGLQIVQQNVELESRMTSLQRVLFYSRDLPREVESLKDVDDISKNIKIVSVDGEYSSSSSSENGTTTPSLPLLSAPSPSSTPTPSASSPSNSPVRQAYVDLTVDSHTKNYSIPSSWPSSGTVEFDHVSYRYRPGLPYVLKDVTFCFRSGEKIGICGRTGAGKSSLIFPLFRLVELDPRLSPQHINQETGFLEPVECDPYAYDDGNTNRGRIIIDGVNIANVNIHRLRSSLAIIPQDPTLFTGTLRNNLDLAGKCTDDEIWEVLELVSLKDIIEKEFDKGLDTEVTEGGRNFSCGQRQLICFGRAMLQKTKVVLMDEATANVDVETDAKIQNTIRNVFKEQTVIVVAHRLNTIINSDRILVMDKGRIAELDTPQNLLNNPNSAFNGLVKSLTG